MEDIIGLVIVFAIYFFLGGKSKKKKQEAKARREKRLAERERRSDFHTAFTDPQEAVQQRDAAVQPQRQHDTMLPPRETAYEESCEGRPIHLHEVTIQQMDEAGEGEDPCHRGGISSGETAMEEEAARNLGAVLQEAGNPAGELLRGVIMSEVLTRPAQRRMLQSNRRRM